jgi:hypothetical protein
MQKPVWSRLTEGNWMVCEPDAVSYCNSEEWCQINPDRSQGVFDPHIVLDNFAKLQPAVKEQQCIEKPKIPSKFFST